MLNEGMNSVFRAADLAGRGPEVQFCAEEASYRSTTDSKVVKNSGNETATASALRIWDSPSARSAAMLNAIAIR